MTVILKKQIKSVFTLGSETVGKNWLLTTVQDTGPQHIFDGCPLSF